MHEKCEEQHLKGPSACPPIEAWSKNLACACVREQLLTAVSAEVPDIWFSSLAPLAGLQSRRALIIETSIQESTFRLVPSCMFQALEANSLGRTDVKLFSLLEPFNRTLYSQPLYSYLSAVGRVIIALYRCFFTVSTLGFRPPWISTGLPYFCRLNLEFLHLR